MGTDTTLKSQENLKNLDRLAKALNFESIRLMVDPQKASSPQAIIEDICGFLELELEGKSSLTQSAYFSI